jgi:hypothetical protein
MRRTILDWALARLVPWLAVSGALVVLGAPAAQAARMSDADFNRYTSDDATIVFGLEAGATPEAVRAAYRAAVKATHPDMFPGADLAELKRIEAAFRHMDALYKRYEAVKVFPPTMTTPVAHGAPTYSTDWPSSGAGGAPPWSPSSAWQSDPNEDLWFNWLRLTEAQRLEALLKLPADEQVFGQIAELLRAFAVRGPSGLPRPADRTPESFDRLIAQYLERRPAEKRLGMTTLLMRIIDRAVVSDRWISQPNAPLDTRAAMGLIAWLQMRGEARDYEALQYLQSRILRVAEPTAEVERVLGAASEASEVVWADLPITYKAALAPKMLFREMCSLIGWKTGRR